MEHFSEVEWTIENISCWKEEVHEDSIDSPTFSSLWFWLFPGGESDRDECMGVRMCTFATVGELSFLCSDGYLIHSQQVVDKGRLHRGPPLEKVLALIKEKEEDTLTLRYRFKSKEEYKEKLRTVIEVIDTTFKIDPVALGCGKIISDFEIQKNNKAYRAYLKSVRNGNVAQLQVEIPFTEGVLLIKTCVSFLKIGYVLEKYEEKEHIFREGEEWVFFSINGRELAERGVAVLFRLKVITGIIHSDPSLHIKGVGIVSNKSACFPEQVSSESAIVTSEQVENSMLVLSKDFLARFLAFLYTGAVGEDLHAKGALNLYHAADKYNVSSLKKDCVKFLSGNVSLSNVCEILSVADKHGGDQLIEVARNFILENYNQVLASENWKTFMKKEPLLVAETLTHFGGNVCVKRQKCK